jgi:hypothetical protein
LLPDGGVCSSSSSSSNSSGGGGGGGGGGGSGSGSGGVGGTNSVANSLQMAPATVGTFKACANTIFICIFELCLCPLHSGNNNYTNSFSRKSLLLYFF